MVTSDGCSMSDSHSKYLLQQRGVALITVLLIVAVLTAIVSRLGFSNQIWLRQVENGSALLQSGQASRAVQDWLGLILLRDDNDYDGHTDLWARPLPPIPGFHGFVQGYMEDMQARFNLNNLLDQGGGADQVAMRQFERLLRSLDLNPGIAEATVDWMDPDDRVTGVWGAEDGYYLGMNPAYLAANQPFTDAAELRLVRGVDRATWQKLKPYVTALPRKTLVNVNTASSVVLAAVVTEWGSPQNGSGEAKRWSEATSRKPFAELQSFYNQAPGFADSEQPTELTVRSQYFMAHTQVDIGHIRQRIATLYSRSGDRVSVVRHKRELE